MTKFSEKKSVQGDMALKQAVARIDVRMDAIVAALREIRARLEKLEVVRAPSPTTTEPESLLDEQKPETE